MKSIKDNENKQKVREVKFCVSPQALDKCEKCGEFFCATLFDAIWQFCFLPLNQLEDN